MGRCCNKYHWVANRNSCSTHQKTDRDCCWLNHTWDRLYYSRAILWEESQRHTSISVFNLVRMPLWILLCERKNSWIHVFVWYDSPRILILSNIHVFIEWLCTYSKHELGLTCKITFYFPSIFCCIMDQTVVIDNWNPFIFWQWTYYCDDTEY